MTDALPHAASALTEHREFLHAIARRLLDDESRADDVVQEAWLAALERPPEAVDSLRAWLARVVRNLALNVRRSEARRARREHECARGESTPGAAEIASRLAVQRDLAGAIAGLSERDREVVYLRFFEGLPPRTIAARLATPVETVRSRLRRALERLRRNLDALHHGERRAWCLALAHVLAHRRPSAVPLAPLAVGAGLVATALALAALSLLAGPGPPAFGALAGSTGPLQREVRMAQPASVRRVEANVPLVAPVPRALLALHLVDVATGVPLPGVSVTIADSQHATHTGASDEQGVVHFPQSLPAGRLELVVRDGTAGRLLHAGALEHAAETGASALRELRLAVGPTYRLHLGAALMCAPEELVCELALPGESQADPGGRTASVRSGRVPWVRFPPLPGVEDAPTGGRSVLELRVRTRDGRLGAETRVHVWPGRYPRPVELELAPRAGARGVIRDGCGRAVPGAVVRFAQRDTSASRSTTSDERGGWELAGLPPGGCQMTVRAPAFAFESCRVELAPGPANVLDTTLSRLPTARLEGRLTSETGAHVPVGAVRLVSLEDPERRFAVQPRRTAEGQRYAFTGVPEGLYRVLPPMGDAFAWRPAWREVAVPGAFADFECLDGALTDDLAFRVRDARSGEPIERFRVLLQVDRELRGWEHAAALDAQLRVDGARNGEVAFRAVPRHLPLEWLVIAKGGQAAGGARGDLVLEDGRLVGSVQVEPRVREHLWVGTRDARGRAQPLADVEIRGPAGVLARSLHDGHAILELAYDPGLLEVFRPGWTVVDDPRRRCPIEFEEYGIRRVWMVPALRPLLPAQPHE